MGENTGEYIVSKMEGTFLRRQLSTATNDNENQIRNEKRPLEAVGEHGYLSNRIFSKVAG